MTDKLNKKKEWQSLLEHYNDVHRVHLRDLFIDQNRAKNFSVKSNDLFLDYSKNIISDKTLSLLFNLARSSNLEKHINDMFSGKRINITENIT